MSYGCPVYVISDDQLLQTNTPRSCDVSQLYNSNNSSKVIPVIYTLVLQITKYTKLAATSWTQTRMKKSWKFSLYAWSLDQQITMSSLFSTAFLRMHHYIVSILITVLVMAVLSLRTPSAGRRSRRGNNRNNSEHHYNIICPFFFLQPPRQVGGHKEADTGKGLHTPWTVCQSVTVLHIN